MQFSKVGLPKLESEILAVFTDPSGFTVKSTVREPVPPSFPE
jgi:hypothetical protein